MSREPEPLPEEATERPRTTVPAQLLHDLRSPLNQIIGYAELLVEEPSEHWPESVVTDLQRIQSAGKRMVTLLEENFTTLGEATRSGAADADFDACADADSSAPALLPVVAPGLLLVVDDDGGNRDVLSRRLRSQGHEVMTAASGHEALRMAREHPFDLVLLDILMADMDGYEVLRQLKGDNCLRHIPVIMISALSEVQSVVRCIEAGAADYLAKPFDPTLLRARIGACLETKRGRDRESLLFEQLEQNIAQMQKAEKLRDDMRNMIVHDLRTPLSSVILGVEMLEKHGELNETQREMMSIAAGGGKTLLGMINDLLDVEKMESGATQLQSDEIEPQALVAGAMEQVASLAEESHTALTSTVPAGLAAFSGDRNLLSRTLVNLIANAVKFTRGGTVTVSAAQEDGQSRFSVRDTGAGIPSESFDRIFEKFGQLDSDQRGGTGLGLAFCKLAVEAHGGAIGVESVVGSGSTFWFTIPLVRSSGRNEVASS